MFGRRIPHALACVVLLLASFAPAGCGTVEKLDRESNDLLDKINDPTPPASSSSRSSDKPKSSGSGLSVARNPNMPVHMIKDARGKTVEIWGQSKSSSTTPGHDRTMEAKAVAMALSGKYEYITLQLSWATATGGVGSSSRRPDVIGVRHDGKVDAFEIQSDSDKDKALRRRLEEGENTLPPERRGWTEVIRADPAMKGGLLDDE